MLIFYRQKMSVKDIFNLGDSLSMTFILCMDNFMGISGSKGIWKYLCIIKGTMSAFQDDTVSYIVHAISFVLFITTCSVLSKWFFCYQVPVSSAALEKAAQRKATMPATITRPPLTVEVVRQVLQEPDEVVPSTAKVDNRYLLLLLLLLLLKWRDLVCIYRLPSFSGSFSL